MQTQLFVQGMETSLRVSLVELSPGAQNPLDKTSPGTFCLAG